MIQLILTQSKPNRNNRQWFLLLVLCLGLTLLLNGPVEAQEPVPISEQQAIAAALSEVGDNDFQISSMGTATNIHNFFPAIAHNATQNEYLVVWQGNTGTQDRDDIDGIYARRVDGATGQPIGRDFLVSPRFKIGQRPDVAYNSLDNEYLVVWSGEDIPDEFQIFGQRIADDGALIENARRIGFMQGGKDFGARTPAVTYARNFPDGSPYNNYLVVWSGEANTGDLRDNEFEIYGTCLEADGRQKGTQQRLSFMGVDGDLTGQAFSPDVAYNSDTSSFLIVWSGAHNKDGMVAGEYEIFAKSFFGNICTPVAAQIRLSHMGPDGDPLFSAYKPQILYNSTEREYFVAWEGGDGESGPVNFDYQIFGLQLPANLVVPQTILRLSDMNPAVNPEFSAFVPALTYNATANEYFVTWVGKDNQPGLAPDEYEIFGQRVDAATGQEKGGNDVRLSDLGPDGDPGYGPGNTAVVYNPVEDEYLVIIQGNDDHPLLFNSPASIFGQRVSAAGDEVGDNDIILSDHQNRLDAFLGYNPAIAYNSQADEFLVVWNGTSNEGSLVAGDYEIFGQRVGAATGQKVGPRLRLSDAGPDGDRDYYVEDAAVAYNPRTNQYFVVWEGDDNRGGLVRDEVEIFGQLLDAAGNEIGPNDFRISDAGPDGDTTYGAYDPAVISNHRDNQFLVVWRGDDDTEDLVNREFEIFGQLLDAAGNEIGPNDFRISRMGPAGDKEYDAFQPALAYNDQRNEYLVVWQGDDHRGGLVNGENEIFAQRLDAGSQLQGDHIRVSYFGPPANPDFDAQEPSAVYNSIANQYLIVWEGEQSITNDENFQEIFGQFLEGSSGQEIGEDFPISNMGGSPTDEFNANDAIVSYDPRTKSYLVVWGGEDNRDILHEDEEEIFGQQIQSDGQLAGEMVRLSDMGPDGDDYFAAENVAIALNPEAGIFLTVWESYDDNASVTPDDFEVYGQLVRLGGGPTPGPDGKFTLYLPLIVK